MAESNEPSMRASDRDREAVAERLRAALEEGRLDLAEYDDRLRRAYGAVVRADLVPLTSDLPEPEAPAPPDAEVVKRDKVKAKRAKEWRDWAGTSFVLIGIWGVISLAVGEAIFFWPIFPVGIWAVVLLAGMLFGDEEDEDEDDDGDSGQGKEGGKGCAH